MVNKSVATHRQYSAHQFCRACTAFTYHHDHYSLLAGARSRTMKRILCRACSGKLEPSKVGASFCFLNSLYQQFTEAFTYLSGVLTLFHSSICSGTCEQSVTECRKRRSDMYPETSQIAWNATLVVQRPFSTVTQHFIPILPYSQIKLFTDGYLNRKKA